MNAPPLEDYNSYLDKMRYHILNANAQVWLNEGCTPFKSFLSKQRRKSNYRLRMHNRIDLRLLNNFRISSWNKFDTSRQGEKCSFHWLENLKI